MPTTPNQLQPDKSASKQSKNQLRLLLESSRSLIDESNAAWFLRKVFRNIGLSATEQFALSMFALRVAETRTAEMIREEMEALGLTTAKTQTEKLVDRLVLVEQLKDQLVKRAKGL